jgi:hypothetical protein
MIRGKSWEDGWLTVYWGRESRGDRKDLMFGSPNRPDGSLLHTAFCFQEIHGKTLIQHLEERGYDISTLQFSVKRNRKPNEEPVTRDLPDLRLEKAQGTAEPEKKHEGKHEKRDDGQDEKPLEDLPLTDPIRWALESILAALPVKRDWLDPELEKLAKDALAEKPRNADESESVYFGFSNKQYADRLADYKKVMADAKDVAPGTYLFDPSKQPASAQTPTPALESNTISVNITAGPMPPRKPYIGAIILYRNRSMNGLTPDQNVSPAIVTNINFSEKTMNIFVFDGSTNQFTNFMTPGGHNESVRIDNYGYGYGQWCYNQEK